MPLTNPTLTAPASLAHGQDGQVVVAFPDLAAAGTFTGTLYDAIGNVAGTTTTVMNGEPFPEIVVGTAPVAGKWTLVATGGAAGDSVSATATPGVFTLHNG